MALRRTVHSGVAATALAAAALSGCASSSPLEPDKTLTYPGIIKDFAETSPFPQRQAVVAEAVPAGSATWLFSVSYGPPLDCPSGCFYSKAYGLLHGSKIGWFEVFDYSQNDLSALALYELGPGDSSLFNQSFLDALKEADSTFYFYFLLRAAQSTAIGSASLLAVIGRIDDTNQRSIVGALLSNPVFLGNCALIRAAAELPLIEMLRPDVDALLAGCPAG